MGGDSIPSSGSGRGRHSCVGAADGFGWSGVSKGEGEEERSIRGEAPGRMGPYCHDKG